MSRRGSESAAYEQVAYVRPGFAFTTGKALFITNLEMPAALVRIEPPAGDTVLTGWSRLAEDGHVSTTRGARMS